MQMSDTVDIIIGADIIITALTAFSNQPLEKGKSLIFSMRYRSAPVPRRR